MLQNSQKFILDFPLRCPSDGQRTQSGIRGLLSGAEVVNSRFWLGVLLLQ